MNLKLLLNLSPATLGYEQQQTSSLGLEEHAATLLKTSSYESGVLKNSQDAQKALLENTASSSSNFLSRIALEVLEARRFTNSERSVLKLRQGIGLLGGAGSGDRTTFDITTPSGDSTSFGTTTVPSGDSTISDATSRRRNLERDESVNFRVNQTESQPIERLQSQIVALTRRRNLERASINFGGIQNVAQSINYLQSQIVALGEAMRGCNTRKDEFFNLRLDAERMENDQYVNLVNLHIDEENALHDECGAYRDEIQAQLRPFLDFGGGTSASSASRNR